MATPFRRICANCGTEGDHVYNFREWRGQWLCEPCEQKSYRFNLGHNDFGWEINWNLHDLTNAYHEFYIAYQKRKNLTHSYHFRFTVNGDKLVFQDKHRCMCGKLLPLNYYTKICQVCNKKLTKQCHRCSHYECGTVGDEVFEDCGVKKNGESIHEVCLTPNCQDVQKRSRRRT
jgi:hypothetical protein